jgi:hypothetical protein
MSQKGANLTRKEQNFLRQKSDFIEEKKLHFSDYVSLSPSCRQRQKEMLEAAKAGNDENTQALIYSGVPAIEIAIDEYLKKYALTAKISKAVGVFNATIKNLDLKNKTEEELAKNAKEREKVVGELKKLRAQIENGEEAKKLKVKFDKDIVAIITKLDADFNAHIADVQKMATDVQGDFSTDDVPISEARLIVSKTQMHIQLQYRILTSDLTNLMEKELKSQAESYLGEYQRYISELVKTDGTDGIELDTTLNLIQTAIPDNSDNLVEQFLGTKIESKTVLYYEGNKDKRWWKPSTWFDKKYREWEEEVTTMKQIVKMGEIFEKYIEPELKDFIQLIEDARKTAKTNAENLERYFVMKMKELDGAVKEAVKKEEDDLKSQEAIEEKIAKNKEKAEWLTRFIKELDRVLEV